MNGPIGMSSLQHPPGLCKDVEVASLVNIIDTRTSVCFGSHDMTGRLVDQGTGFPQATATNQEAGSYGRSNQHVSTLHSRAKCGRQQQTGLGRPGPFRRLPGIGRLPLRLLLGWCGTQAGATALLAKAS